MVGNDDMIIVHLAVVFLIDLDDRFLASALVRLLEKKHDALFRMAMSDDDDDNDETVRIFCDGLQTPQDVEDVKTTIRSYLNLMA